MTHVLYAVPGVRPRLLKDGAKVRILAGFLPGQRNVLEGTVTTILKDGTPQVIVRVIGRDVIPIAMDSRYLEVVDAEVA